MFWQSWALQIALGFIIRQVAKWKTSIRWDLVKKDIEPRVRALVPGTLFDDLVLVQVNRLVDICAAALSQTSDLEAFIRLCSKGDFSAAAALLKKLILKSAVGSTLVDKVILAAVSSLVTDTVAGSTLVAQGSAPDADEQSA